LDETGERGGAAATADGGGGRRAEAWVGMSGPHQNRGLYCFHRWSWGFILSLHILKLGLQKRFGGLNLKGLTGVALIGLSSYRLSSLVQILGIFNYLPLLARVN
jgi:hypothetical protein